jgi:hypothetical protein
MTDILKLENLASKLLDMEAEMNEGRTRTAMVAKVQRSGAPVRNTDGTRVMNSFSAALGLAVAAVTAFAPPAWAARQLWLVSHGPDGVQDKRGSFNRHFPDAGR